MPHTAHKLAQFAPFSDDHSAAEIREDGDHQPIIELPAFIYPRALRTHEVTVPVGESLESIIENELYLRECEERGRRG